MGAVRNHYPDLASAPSDMKEAVPKAEALNQADRSRAQPRFMSVGEVAEQLAELKEMQVRHRDAWVKHLREALASWEGQVNSYVSLQKTYRELMSKAQAELNTARLQTRCLNQRAGKKVEGAFDLTTSEDPLSKDEEAAGLVKQVQAVLERCAEVARPEARDESENMFSSDDHQICRACQPWKWTRIWWSLIMNLGDGAWCLQNFDRAPHEIGAGGETSADAYAGLNDCCAASTSQPLGSLCAFRYATHSIRYEHDFKDKFNALHFASDLRGQVLLCDDVLSLNCSYASNISQPSCLLRAGDQCIAKSVHFDELNLARSSDGFGGDEVWLPPHESFFEEADDLSCTMATFHRYPHPEARNVADNPEAAQQDWDAHDQQEADDDSVESELSFSPDSVEHTLPWHSVAIHDTRVNAARGCVPFQPYESFFSHVRRLIGMGHHEVARIVQITPSPEELQRLAVTPLLVLRHDDFDNGDIRQAVLVDIEYHGSTFDTPVETDRFIAKIPSPIHRSRFFEWIRIDRYCSGSRNHCLVWHHGRLVPQQWPAALQLEHGDLRVAVPPGFQKYLRGLRFDVDKPVFLCCKLNSAFKNEEKRRTVSIPTSMPHSLHNGSIMMKPLCSRPRLFHLPKLGEMGSVPPQALKGLGLAMTQEEKQKEIK